MPRLVLINYTIRHIGIKSTKQNVGLVGKKYNARYQNNHIKICSKNLAEFAIGQSGIPKVNKALAFE